MKNLEFNNKKVPLNPENFFENQEKFLANSENVSLIQEETKRNGLETLERENFVKKYQKEKSILDLVASYYENNNSISRVWLDDIYIERDAVFVSDNHHRQQSKIFSLNKKDENNYEIEDSKNNYFDIKSCWDFYIGINTQAEEKDGFYTEKEWKRRYTLLEKNGEIKKELRGYFDFQKRDKDNSSSFYREYYTKNNGGSFQNNQEWEKYNAYYDQNMNVLIEDVPEKTSLLTFDENEILFWNNTDQKNIVFDRKSKTFLEEKNKVENTSIYKKYRENYDVSVKKYRDSMKKQRNLPLEYNINFEGETKYIKNILNKKWEIIFDSDNEERKNNEKYILDFPSVWSFWEKENINKWFFLVRKVDNEGKYLWETSFVNANTWESKKFTSESSRFTFLKGKVLESFFNSNRSKIYTVNWEELWVTVDYNREKDFLTFKNGNNKKQVVETKTWKVMEQEFDERLYIYDWEEEKTLIVQNWEDLFEINIKK